MLLDYLKFTTFGHMRLFLTLLERLRNCSKRYLSIKKRDSVNFSMVKMSSFFINAPVYMDNPIVNMREISQSFFKISDHFWCQAANCNFINCVGHYDIITFFSLLLRELNQVVLSKPELDVEAYIYFLYETAMMFCSDSSSSLIFQQVLQKLFILINSKLIESNEILLVYFYYFVLIK